MALTLHGNNGLITTNGTAAAPSIAAPDSDTGLYFGTNLIHATTDGTARLSIIANGKVGIGTTAPTQKLEVLGTTNLFGNGAASVQWGDTDYVGHLSFASDGAIIRSASGKALIFHTNHVNERLRITSAGLISVGDASNLDSQLTITQAQGDCIRLRTSATNNTFKYGIIKQEPYNNNALGVQIIGGKSDSGYSEVAIGGGIDGGYAATQIDFYTGATTTTATGTKRLRISSDGRVQIAGQNAIATTSLTHRLLVRSQNDSNAIAIAGRNGDHIGELSFYQSDASTKIGDIEGHSTHLAIVSRVGYIQFATGGASEKARIDSSGRLRVGNTTASADGAFDDLIVGNHSGNRGISILSANGQQGALGFAKSGTLADGYVAYVHNSTATSSAMTLKSSGHIQFNAGSSEQVRIDSDGRLRIGNTTQNQYTAADDLIVGSGSGDRGLTIYSGGSDAGVIAFSDGTSDTAYRSGQIIYSHASDAMDFRTNGNYIRLKLTSTGQVRIDGSTSANHGLRFTPGGWNGYDNRMGYCGTSGSDFWWSSNWNPTDGSRDHSSYATNYIRQSATGNGITFGTGDTNVSASERMKIMKDGKVGVNLTQPQTVLNVKGDISTGRNVAREVGTIINISSSYSGTRNGVSVINGQKNYEEDTNADWITANGQRANANLTIDLGAQYTCDRFVIYNQNEYANNVREVKRFTLEGSNDNSSWTTILDDEAGASYGHEPNPGWSFHMPANNFDDVEGVTYRYWKFTMKTYHGSTSLGGVMELELYEASNTNHSEISSHSVVATDIYARTIHHEAPAFFACRTSSFSIPNEQVTLVQFVDNQGPGFDTNGCWDNSNYRFVPNVPGYYQINLTLSVSYGAPRAGRIYIFKNGGAYAMSQLYFNSGDSYDDISMQCSTLVFLNGTGDYIDGRAWRNGGNGGLGDNETNQQISGFLARSCGPRRHGDGVA